MSHWSSSERSEPNSGAVSMAAPPVITKVPAVAPSQLQKNCHGAVVHQFDLHVRPEHAGLHVGTEPLQRLREGRNQGFGDDAGGGRVPGGTPALAVSAYRVNWLTTNIG